MKFEKGGVPYSEFAISNLATNVLNFGCTPLDLYKKLYFRQVGAYGKS